MTTVISSGQTLTIAGQTSSGLVVDAGGLVFVSSGGTTIGTVLSGGEEEILSGGFAAGTIISSGSLAVFGGTASGTIVSGGS
jgi:autotransporter passenger strand-loop-strand repeat protein